MTRRIDVWKRTGIDHEDNEMAGVRLQTEGPEGEQGEDETGGAEPLEKALHEVRDARVQLRKAAGASPALDARLHKMEVDLSIHHLRKFHGAYSEKSASEHLARIRAAEGGRAA